MAFREPFWGALLVSSPRPPTPTSLGTAPLFRTPPPTLARILVQDPPPSLAWHRLVSHREAMSTRLAPCLWSCGMSPRPCLIRCTYRDAAATGGGKASTITTWSYLHPCVRRGAIGRQPGVGVGGGEGRRPIAFVLPRDPRAIKTSRGKRW